MQIKFMRKVKTKELIKEFKKKDDSLEKLERYLERHPDDYPIEVEERGDLCHRCVISDASKTTVARSDQEISEVDKRARQESWRRC